MENKRLLTVSEYAAVSGVSVQAVYKYETGRGYPPVDTMFALMELFDAGINDITRDYEEDVKSSFVILEESELAA